MSRYVLREDILSFPSKRGDPEFIKGISTYRDWLANLAYIDVVRCEECEHYQAKTGFCKYHKNETKKRHYCSAGERK